MLFVPYSVLWVMRKLVRRQQIIFLTNSSPWGSLLVALTVHPLHLRRLGKKFATGASVVKVPGRSIFFIEDGKKVQAG
ncbi:unnamed protein product [Brassica oleracea]